METLKAEYKNGFWYINGKPKLFVTTNYKMSNKVKGWHYILVHNNTLIEALPCQSKS